jgi:hypothetical protein
MMTTESKALRAQSVGRLGLFIFEDFADPERHGKVAVEAVSLQDRFPLGSQLVTRRWTRDGVGGGYTILIVIAMVPVTLPLQVWWWTRERVERVAKMLHLTGERFVRVAAKGKEAEVLEQWIAELDCESWVCSGSLVAMRQMVLQGCEGVEFVTGKQADIM